MPVSVVDGWREIQANERALRYSQRLIRGVEKYNKDTGAMVKYLAEFVGLTCAPDMVALRLFPNGKEISESFGAFDAVRYRLQEFRLSDPGVTMVSVGDGCTPRTAATFALRSRWRCYSVDPLLRGGTKRWESVERLNVYACKIEQARLPHADRLVVVAVHSHAKLEAVLKSVQADEIAVIAIPCCVPQFIDGQEPDLTYTEKGIISACRTVKIWRRVRAGRCPARSHKPRTSGSTPEPATSCACSVP